MTRRKRNGLLAIVLSGSAVVTLPIGCAANRQNDPERAFLSNITQLTSSDMGLINAGEAYFSPDGYQIIFQGTPAGKDRYQIYTLDLDTRKLRMVSTGKGGCTCAYYRPDGNKIIFASSHLGPYADAPPERENNGRYEWFFDEHFDVFEADPDGSNLARLTDAPGYDAECAYAPDGKRIAFASQRDGDLEIYVMDSDGANQTRLTRGPGYDGGPFFSPDGKRILYRGDRRGDDKMNLQLRTIDADGRNDRAITDNALFNWCPYWYPSGKSLIFTQVDHDAWAGGERPNYDLFMTTPDGQEFVRITYDPAFDGLPVFSPDGRKLLWSSKRGGLEETQVFIADFKLPQSLD